MSIFKKVCAWPLHFQVLLAVFLGAMLGVFTNEHTVIFRINIFSCLAFMGTFFLNALKMVVVPLVVASIISSIGKIGSGKELGRVGLKSITYYLITSLLAILLGLLLVNLMKPGISNGVPIQLNAEQINNASQVVDTAKEHSLVSIFNVFLDLAPSNIFAAAADGQMLGLISFSFLFGYCINLLSFTERETMRNFWQGSFDIMMNVTMIIMKFAPIGIFALIAKAFMTFGLNLVLPILTFFICVLLALAIHTFVTMSTLLFLLAKVNPFAHLKAMFPALITAFSTSSSAATLPLTLECLERESGVSNRISSFVLPLGATINMDGTALYECVAAMFIAQAYGIDLSISTQFMVVMLALLTSIGVAGIPSASLVAITLILGAAGVPLEGVGLLLVTDRILDMCRTSVNIYGDSCGALLIARTEGEKTKVDLN